MLNKYGYWAIANDVHKNDNYYQKIDVLFKNDLMKYVV